MRRNAYRAQRCLLRAASICLLATVFLAPTVAGLTWLRGGHILPDDLALHNWLRAVQPSVNHHGPLYGPAREPQETQARGIAFALGGNAAGVLSTGLAAVLLACGFVLWQAWTRAARTAPLVRPPSRDRIPDLPPPR